ncbi:flagellar hook-length control protein FliK [Sulfuricurvum sp.]|uniref:flagellar hook-length control protein FliK n=1 Tax=Sulfuricurvum sp. TaxID=2025608 RepID=UPI002D66B339|nr:flagellar hook-length control protein FliK [Sulfuricurvum sp.]HZF71668.1 flagellar hook-length control protein FliK [Sulfuricurvum sp.]
MINLNTDARLNIILPNTNKALAEAIKNATPEQLSQLKEGKDIKSLLTSVFQDKITATKSDAVLLDILKNSAAFKNMGSLTDNLQSLLKELKTSPDLSPKIAVMEKFLKNIDLIDSKTLKTQIVSSGVFMESKFAAALQKIPDLTQTFEQLRTILTKSPLNEAKVLQQQISTLLESPILSSSSHDLKSALVLTDTLKKVTENLHTLISKSDPLYSKEVSALAQKLDQLSAVQEIKTAISQLYGTLLSSNASDTNTLLDSIEKLLKNLDNAPTEELKTFTQNLKSAIKEGNITQELSQIITKLDAFTDPKTLVTETFLKESMENDLKSNLLSLREELTQSRDPNAPKLLEQTDKLLTQIDYHQITSYIGSSNSLYIPFAWDQLEEGSMAFKKTADKKFYCEINLRLKEYGELNLMMALYEGNQLEIQAHTEKPELKTLIHDNIGTLRSLLIDAGLTPRAIRVFEMKETQSPLKETYGSDTNGSDLGFEVKV